MIIKEFFVEILLVVVLLALAFGILNPYYMPMGLHLLLLLWLVVLFGIFSVFLWREQGGDEREESLRHRSDRIGFLAGGSVLILAIVVEGLLFRTANGWVIGALALMIVAKVIAYIYHQHRN